MSYYLFVGLKLFLQDLLFFGDSILSVLTNISFVSFIKCVAVPTNAICVLIFIDQAITKMIFKTVEPPRY